MTVPHLELHPLTVAASCMGQQALAFLGYHRPGCPPGGSACHALMLVAALVRSGGGAALKNGGANRRPHAPAVVSRLQSLLNQRRTVKLLSQWRQLGGFEARCVGGGERALTREGTVKRSGCMLSGGEGRGVQPLPRQCPSIRFA